MDNGMDDEDISCYFCNLDACDDELADEVEMLKEPFTDIEKRFIMDNCSPFDVTAWTETFKSEQCDLDPEAEREVSVSSSYTFVLKPNNNEENPLQTCHLCGMLSFVFKSNIRDLVL
jgi:hypothetical protein